MFAIITRRKLLDLLYFSVVVGVLYYYSSHLSFPRISIKYRPDNRQHERNFSVPHPSSPPSRKYHTHILHPDPPAGFAAFSRLYVLKGTLIAVVEDRKSYPALRYLISRPVHPGNSQDNEPTNKVSATTTVVLAILKLDSQRKCGFLLRKKPHLSLALLKTLCSYQDSQLFSMTLINLWGQVILDFVLVFRILIWSLALLPLVGWINTGIYAVLFVSLSATWNGVTPHGTGKIHYSSLYLTSLLSSIDFSMVLRMLTTSRGETLLALMDPSCELLFLAFRSKPPSFGKI